MTTYEKIIRGLPQQFQGKPKLNSFLQAASAQYDELEAVFRSLNVDTDISRATGENLDRIGDIVVMSRKQAYAQLRKSLSVEITDSIYRTVLRFGILKNNTDATYEDIMKGLRMLWGDEVKLTYIENPNYPAQVTIRMEQVSLDDEDPAATRPLAIHPAGVLIVFETEFRQDFLISAQEKFEDATLTWNKRYYFNGEVQFDGSIQFQSREVEEAL